MHLTFSTALSATLRTRSSCMRSNIRPHVQNNGSYINERRQEINFFLGPFAIGSKRRADRIILFFVTDQPVAPAMNGNSHSLIYSSKSSTKAGAFASKNT